MNIKQCGYVFLLVAICFNTIYAYNRGRKKREDTVAHLETPKKTSKAKKVAQSQKTDPQSFSFLANLKKTVAGESKSLRPSRSARIAMAKQRESLKKKFSAKST